jgi:hypothetical protein
VTERVDVGPAPYAWLLALPGFSELRVPTRFWMLGVLCMGVAAGLSSFASAPTESKRRLTAFALVAVALLVDGWMHSIPMAQPPALWPVVEPQGRVRFWSCRWGPTGTRPRPFDRSRTVGPSTTAPGLRTATLRTPARRAHGSRPGHAARGSHFRIVDVVIDRVNDPDGEWTRRHELTWRQAVAGAAARTAYRVPAANPPEEMGPNDSIVRVDLSMTTTRLA